MGLQMMPGICDFLEPLVPFPGKWVLVPGNACIDFTGAMIIIDCLTTSSWVMISTFILKDGEHFHVIIHVMFDDREYCPRKFSCQRFPPFSLPYHSFGCMHARWCRCEEHKKIVPDGHSGWQKQQQHQLSCWEIGGPSWCDRCFPHKVRVLIRK